MYEIKQVKEGYLVTVIDDHNREMGSIAVDKFDVMYDLMKVLKQNRDQISIDFEDVPRLAELGRLVNKLLNER